MKNLKKPILFAITLVVAGLVLISTASSFTYERREIISDQSEILSCSEMSVSADAFLCKPNIVKIETTNPEDKLSRDTDVLVLAGEQDYQNAAIVSDNSMNNILIFSEKVIDITQHGMWGRFSTDGGVTWSEDSAGWDEISQEGDIDDIAIPKLDLYDGNEAWGTWKAGGNFKGMVYFLSLPDITDPSAGDQWSLITGNWGDSGFDNFDSADVACYPYNPDVSPNEFFWGLVAGSGDRPAGTDFEDHTMWFSYFVDETNLQLISFFNMDNDAHKLVCDIDISTARPYLAYEYTSETNTSDVGTRIVRCPVIQPPDAEGKEWWEVGSFTMIKYKSLLNPDITAADKHVYIVGSTLEGDIKCYYSANGGMNYRPSIVSDATGEETYPQVTMLGSNVICSYTRNGNLYAKISIDGGATWGTEKLVNDNSGTAVEQEGCSAINGQFAAWTDERSSVKEIYFDTTFEIGSPPADPSISGPKKLKPGESKEYTFTTTDPDNNQIYYYVDWGDGTIVDWQGPYNSGESYKASHSWSEKKGYTIKCKARDTMGLESNYGTLDISTPRNSGLILKFLETLQHIFPNLW